MNFVKWFFYRCWNERVMCFLASLFVMYYICWLGHVEPTIHPCYSFVQMILYRIFRSGFLFNIVSSVPLPLDVIYPDSQKSLITFSYQISKLTFSMKSLKGQYFGSLRYFLDTFSYWRFLNDWISHFMTKLHIKFMYKILLMFFC